MNLFKMFAFVFKMCALGQASAYPTEGMKKKKDYQE